MRIGRPLSGPGGERCIAPGYAFFNKATVLLLGNDLPGQPSSIVCDENARLQLFYMLGAHYAELQARTNNGGAGMVGNVQSASEGSVSIGMANYPVGTGKWYEQTQPGAEYWQAMQGYMHGGLYFAPPRCFPRGSGRGPSSSGLLGGRLFGRRPNHERAGRHREKTQARHQGDCGFPKGSTYDNGTPIATAAAANNYGSPAKGIPPRPFFSNAITEHSNRARCSLSSSARASSIPKRH